MAFNRRDLLKVGGLSVAAAMFAGCTTSSGPQTTEGKKVSKMILPKPTGNRVVVIGAGFGGLSLARSVRENNPNAEVIVLEKRDIFMSCPFSNTYLAELEDVELSTLTRDFYAPAKEFGYKFMQCEVLQIDRKTKTVSTSIGDINYDILALAPGIAYDYKAQFPKWDDAKIAKVAQEAPAAMITGSEHLALKRLLSNMEDGNVIITVPSGKYRCPPAPYERACMIAHYMKKEDIRGKVIILDAAPKPRAKAAAFMETFTEVYSDIIEFRGDVTIEDVDLENQVIHYYTEDKDLNVKKYKDSYQVLNLIPQNRAHPLIELSGIKTNAWGGAQLSGAGFTSVTDSSIYVVGDCVGHAIPPSGQTANWAGKRAGKHIAQRLAGKAVDEMNALPYKNANVCYSMVSGDPEEAIMVTHDFSFVDGVLKGKGSVPKDKASGKFRTRAIGKATREWYRGIISDMFGV